MGKQFAELPDELNVIASGAIEAAFKVHRALGPGLLESVYESCLFHELQKASLSPLRQVILPIHYDGIELDEGFRIDILVSQSLIIEVKAVAEPLPVHTAQLLTYLRLSRLKLGLLINFNSALLKDGIKRIVAKSRI